MYPQCNTFIDEFTAIQNCTAQLKLCQCLQDFLNIDFNPSKPQLILIIENLPSDVIPKEYCCHFYPITTLTPSNINFLIQHHCTFLDESIPVHRKFHSTITVNITPLPAQNTQENANNTATQTDDICLKMRQNSFTANVITHSLINMHSYITKNKVPMRPIMRFT